MPASRLVTLRKVLHSFCGVHTAEVHSGWTREATYRTHGSCVGECCGQLHLLPRMTLSFIASGFKLKDSAPACAGCIFSVKFAPPGLACCLWELTFAELAVHSSGQRPCILSWARVCMISEIHPVMLTRS